MTVDFIGVPSQCDSSCGVDVRLLRCIIYRLVGPSLSLILILSLLLSLVLFPLLCADSYEKSTCDTRTRAHSNRSVHIYIHTRTHARALYNSYTYSRDGVVTNSSRERE